MHTKIREVILEDLPIIFDETGIKLPCGWQETSNACPDCTNTLIETSGLLVCVACYIHRVQAHTGRTLLARLSNRALTIEYSREHEAGAL